jgi:hypothetical protein
MWHSGQQYRVEPSSAVVRRISPGLGRRVRGIYGFFLYFLFFFFFDNNTSSFLNPEPKVGVAMAGPSVVDDVENLRKWCSVKGRVDAGSRDRYSATVDPGGPAKLCQVEGEGIIAAMEYDGLQSNCCMLLLNSPSLVWVSFSVMVEASTF